MPTLTNSKVAPPKGWEEFENIVCSAAKNRWDNPDFTLHGRQGQRQDGVDVYGKASNGELVGLQCKNTCSGVTEKTIKEEVAKAELFSPALDHLYVVTTADTDKTIQALIRTLSDEREAVGKFRVDILFWIDVWNDLALDERRLFQHYPHLKPASGQQLMSHDQLLFQEFQSVFSYEPAVRLLREHDFGGPFIRKAIQPLNMFVDTWDQPEKEFIDQELQAALSDLYQAAQTMAYHINNKTVPVGNGELASVYSDSLRAAGPRPDWVREEARIINEQSQLFVPVYEKFFRLCREKLRK